ncbi:pyrimidine-specific ribonucleoside hydrolase RihB [Devosia yakushimensis]|uniref:Pyrimidine-specific ribonucleoside hydrolase RihB n=1 Tax=Devosia yakushimensis TaxID=470028 RepID=A0ABQ5UKC7_9HYPH|nr:nucleoside hydrolase [Devosia yakushimensis]GLQ11916.1 pyrimidine-specific ribonucleoside hydrolase RihB [Devosia yakushimensis]
MTKHRIIIDCDPGHDDMAAILLAAWHEAITIEAITTVCGNASVDNTTNNALRIVDAFGLDVPVYRGAELPLLNRYEFPAEFHGPSGLDSSRADLAQTSRKAEAMHAVQAIIELVDANPGEISVVVVGPMTNLALAFGLRPDLAGKIKQIVFMGGSATEGNITPAAEFNIWADAHAARMVFRSGVKLVMFGLNLTHQTLLRRQDIAAVRAAHPGENAVADIMDFYCGTYYRFAGADKPGAPLHDPCAIAYLIDPSLFEVRQLPGEVIVGDDESYGQTLIDIRPQDLAHDTRNKNVGVAMTADAERFATLVTQALVWAAGRLSAQS